MQVSKVGTNLGNRNKGSCGRGVPDVGEKGKADTDQVGRAGLCV